jgi:cytoskeletal protein CcmA (bactofilin family)
MIFKSDTEQTDLNGFLDAGSHVQGELEFENTFRIDGRFTGTVRSDGNLIIGEGGQVQGEIEVGQVFISGKLEGQVRAHRRVQIAPTGKVFGSLHTPALVVEDGALFEGQCMMSHRAPAPSAKSPQADAVASSGHPDGGKVAHMPTAKKGR